ncbi:TnsD family Tn7-like transposition protein [Janthinobacterium sp. YR213]|uniref:TnsD family Tn7-like transposition protein n=1 Tax=Janthinobacterium sp. YR213 TaxID=1881027 RepID=UPI00147F9929|nr:TnsD family Tn7-like transposition protein [Janthinobacterium sp. YR213]
MMRSMPLFAAFDLPKWLPDETFYSLACRYHRLSCNATSKATLNQLFGKPRLGYQHDFPSGLDAFASRTNSTLGTASQIIRQRTVLPFYLPMRQPVHAAEMMAAFEAGDISSLKFRLGILTSRFRAHHPLKACTECMREDLARHSVSYWHLSHQFPGVWLCPDHSTVLHEATVKANGVGRFQFYLPNHNILEPAWQHREASSNHDQIHEHLSLISSCSLGLARLPAYFHFSATTLQSTYNEALKRRGLTTKSGALRLSEVCHQFGRHIAPLSVIPEIALQKSDAADLPTQLGRILRLPRTGTHPLRHLFLISWLFGGWDQFFSAYNAAFSTTTVEQAGVKSAPKQESAQVPSTLALIGLIQKGGSVSGAARELGMDVSTAMAALAQKGISSKRRPKLLHSILLDTVVKDIKSGTAILEIATKHHLSVTTITRTKNTIVGLHDAWINARATSQKQAMREAWGATKLEFPCFGIKLLRAQTPAVYMWLYRHDREWLKNNQPAPNTARSANRSALRWDERDTTLSLQVQEVTLQLLESTGQHPVRLWQIYQRIPELKAKLDVLDRLPKTRRALETAITARRQSQAEKLL